MSLSLSTLSVAPVRRHTKRLPGRTGRFPLALERLEDRVTPAPLQIFYVPMPETETNGALDVIGNGVQGTLQTSIVAISVTENNTVLWYDHWEDGYEAILGNPLQASTRVWGDNNNANGIAPGFVNDPDGIPAGTVFRLRNNVPTPRNVGVDGILFDSPDKFGSDKTVAVSRSQFTNPDGTVLASAVEVRDTRFYDTDYRAPVGVNTLNAGQMFEYTSFFVQGYLDNTHVQIDANNDGDFVDADDRDVILNQGQTIVSGQNVVQGGRVLADKPVQVDLLTGDIGSGFASRTYALYSVGQAANDYFTPVGFDSIVDTTNDDVRLYVYNPNAGNISVQREDVTGLVGAPVVVAPGASAFFDVTTNTGTRLFTVGGEDFLAIGTHDQQGTTHDWGFSLQPVAELSQIALVGLGVGNSNEPPSGGAGAGNFSPIFVTALGTTILQVDRDGDGTVDQTIPMVRLQTVRLRDTLTSDNDNSGMRIYTLNGVLISTTWGEDGTAPTGVPGYDAGTTVPAVPVPEFFKFSTFAPGGDLNGDGFFNEGEVVQYSVRIRNISTVAVSGVNITDSLPTFVNYVTNSTTIETNGGGQTSIPDSGGTAFPLDEAGYGIANIAAGDEIFIRFSVSIGVGLPVGTTQILNRATLTYDIFRLPAVDVITLFKPSAIGNRVWLDEDGNGMQDAGEDGIAGATVSLTPPPSVNLGNGAGVPLTTITGADGSYLFPNLPPDYTYSVTVSGLPASMVQTFDPDGTLNSTTNVTPGAGQEVMTTDFGYNWTPASDSTAPAAGATGAIGDRLWIDADADGVQDAGEAGLAGVTVELFRDADGNGTYETSVGTTTTNAVGNYIFDGLAPGAYQIVVNGGATPAGYTQTGDPDGTLNNRTIGVVAPGDVFVNADFGYDPAAGSTIGDQVFIDANGNGVQDVGEPGIGGVTVNLLNNLGQVVATDITDANGLYIFPNLPAGTYTVVVTDTNYVLQFLDPSGDADGLGTPNSSSVVVDGTNPNLNQDFAYEPHGQDAGEGALGDRLFLDRNNNAVYDAGEGLEGVIIELYDGSGTLVAIKTTSENGQYIFGGLSPDTYTVRIVTATLPGTAGQLTNTIDPDGGTADQATVILAAGGVNLNQDFGYRDLTTPNTISGTLFNDLNADGALNEAAPALPGVTVVLMDSLGNIVATTTTDASGNYSFSGIPDGTYTVDVTDDANVLAGYWHTLGTADTNNQSQVDPSTETVAGGVTADNDFGYYLATATLGDFVWSDLNGDGDQDLGEPGLPNVLVRLRITYPNGAVTDVFTTTDVNGNYAFQNFLVDESFNGLGGGEPTFVVSVTPPTGAVFTLQDQGGNDSLDSDINPATGNTANLTIVQGAVNNTVDAGLLLGADLRLTKTVTLLTDSDGSGAGNITPGDIVLFTITVFNDGPNNATGVGIGDLLPTGYSSPTNISNGGTFSGGAVSWPGLSIANGGNLVLTFRATVNATGNYTNVAEVTDSDQPDLDSTPDPTPDNDPPTQDDEATDTPVITPVADLRLTKTVTLFTDTDGSGAGNITPGDIVLFTITVFNDGPNIATGVGVGDLLPSGYSSPTNISSGGTFGGGIVSWTGLSVASGGNLVLTFRATVNAGGTYTNVAEVTASDLFDPDSQPDPTADSDPPGQDDEATATPVITPEADLRLTKTVTLFTDTDGSGAGNITPGDIVLFTITVFNDGPSNATGVGIGDLLPSGFSSPTNISNGGTFGGGIVSWTGLSIANGGSLALTFRTTINASGNYTNVAEVTVNGAFDPDSQPDPTADNDPPAQDDEATDTVVVTPEADLGVFKTDGQTTYAAGAPISYTITVTNNGPNTLTSLFVNDILPPELVGPIFTPNTGSYNPGTGAWTGLNLAMGQSIILTLSGTISATATANLVNTATVSPPPGTLDLIPGNNTSTDTDTPAPASAGDRVWYDVDADGVQDAGEPGIPGATVTVTWFGPDGNLGGGDDQTFNATTGGNGIWTIGSLPTGNFGVTSSNPNGLTTQVSGPTGFTLVAGQNRTDVDLGYRGIGALGDFIWNDQDGDGVQDAGEPGLPSIGVTLTWLGFNGVAGGGDDVVLTTTTNLGGNFGFANLPSGNFSVDVNNASLPGNLALTTPTDPRSVSLPIGGTNLDVDFGYRGTASVGDRVWVDQNGDGVQQASEGGIPGASVQLRWAGPDGILDNGDDVFYTTTTGANGLYLFSGLPIYGTSDNYRATVTALPIAGLAPTFDLDGLGTPGTAAFLLTTTGANLNRRNADFGYDGQSSVSGTVFSDNDNDGFQDPGELGIPGVTITLTGTDDLDNPVLDPITGQPYRVTTNASGVYTISTIVSGTYTLTETQPLGWNDGIDTAGVPFGGTAGNDVISGLSVGAAQSGTGYTFAEIPNQPPGGPTTFIIIDGLLSSDPNIAVRCGKITFSISGTSDHPQDEAVGFTYQFDWNNDGIVDEQTPAGLGTSTIYTAGLPAGLLMPRVRAVDRHGAAGLWVNLTMPDQTVTVYPAITINDTLWVGGTDGTDNILVDTTNPANIAVIHNNVRLINPDDGSTRFTLSATGRVVIQGCGGNDVIQTPGYLEAEAYGGPGNDRLFGGSARDLLFGGDGKDYISAGQGHDVVIGGRGKDTLLGGDGDDILVAGEVYNPAYSSYAALRQLSLDWVASLPPTVLQQASVTVDNLFASEFDQLTGGRGRDAFVFRSGVGGDRLSDFRVTELDAQLPML
jgi:uncharacterized repeat protein (TIGR01451 family)